MIHVALGERMVSSRSPNTSAAASDGARNGSSPREDLEAPANGGWSQSGPPSLSAESRLLPDFYVTGTTEERCTDVKIPGEEQFEAFGSVESETFEESPDGSSSAPSPTLR